jgi:zinc protease
MSISSRVTELTLPTGGRAAILPTNVKDVVTIRGSIIGGPAAFTGSGEVAADLAANLLDAGAGKLGKEAFRGSIASKGAELRFGTADARLTWSASCFPEDLPFLLARIGDAVFSPHLASPDFSAEKVRTQADLDDEAGDTRAQSEIGLARLIYPASHPNYQLSTGEKKKFVSGLALSELKSVAKQYGTGHLALAIVGDISVKQAREAIEKAFRKASAGRVRPSAEAIDRSTRPDARRESISIPDKANTDVSLGSALGFGMDDKRYLPTAVVTHMLGSHGFTSHLMSTVRERDGLTYGTYAWLKGFSDKLDGYLHIWGMFAPQLLVRGQEALERETGIFLKGGVTEDALREVKDEIAGSYAVSLASTHGLARMLVRIMEEDRPIARIDEYPELIRAITLKEAQDAAAYLESLPLSIATAGSI